MARNIPDNTTYAMLSQKSLEILGIQPLKFQLDAADAILQGKDVILDVGTGSGKSLCFILPLLLNESDISLVISPLTALMMEQAEKSPIPSIAVCQETLAANKEKIISVRQKAPVVQQRLTILC
jgi:superfamily II DNA helicase RecQ